MIFSERSKEIVEEMLDVAPDEHAKEDIRKASRMLAKGSSGGPNPLGDLLKRRNTQKQFTDGLEKKYDEVKNDPNLDPAAKFRELERINKALQNAKEHLARLNKELDDAIGKLGGNPPPANP